MVLLVNYSHGQDLLNSRIRKLNGSKTAIFHSEGIFHYRGRKKIDQSSLKLIRYSYSQKKGYERIVLDFNSGEIPNIYGYFTSTKKRLYIDLFNTILNDGITSIGSAKYVKSVNFYPWSDNTVSVELDFRNKVSVDVFYLESPGRLVVDIKS